MVPMMLGLSVLGQTQGREASTQLLERARAAIRGREGQPAGQVFKNVQFLKNVPAATFLVIMDVGYSRGLGVECTHCHVEQDLASDEKRPKRAAREMQVMHRAFNDHLQKMQHAETPAEKRFINCSTCHRGRPIPEAQ
jgi:photosynthetic reaction center cytochrome c subunit